MKITIVKIAQIYSNYAVINAVGEILDGIQLPSFEASEICQRGDFLATGTVYLKSNIMQMGGYNTEKINSGLENYQLILELLNLGHIGFHVPLQLFGYRRHGSNLSEIKKKQIIAKDMKRRERTTLKGRSTSKP